MRTGTLLCFLIIGVCQAQSSKPRVYIDSVGRRYTRTQFDSIGAANLGKSIAQIKRVEKENQIEITFAALSVDPFEAFTTKWTGQRFPNFALTDVNGKQHTNRSLAGKLTIFNFWSVTCGPCLLEMPQLSKLVTQYSPKDVLFLAPAPEVSIRIEKLLLNHPFTYTVLPEAGNLFTALGIRSYPYHVIVDKKGLIRAIYHGSQVDTKTNQAVLDERLVESINAALKE